MDPRESESASICPCAVPDKLLPDEKSNLQETAGSTRELSSSARHTDTRGLIIFDVCGTLYNSNTTFDFLEFYWSRKGAHLSLVFLRLSRSLIGKIFWAVASRVSGKDLFRTVAIRTLAGERCDAVEAVAQTFAHDILASRSISPVIELFRAQRLSGARLVLLSASICPVVRAIAINLSADGYYCTSLVVNDGRYGGSIERDMRGIKKQVYLQEMERGGDFTFVTNNREDLPLLEIASTAYIVARNKDLKFWKSRMPAHARLIEVG